MCKMVRIVKWGMLILVAGIIASPLRSNDWHLQEGFLLLAFGCFCYAFFLLTQCVFHKRKNGSRIEIPDLILLGALPLYLLYVSNERFLNSLDTYPLRYLPRLIVEKGTMDLSQETEIPEHLPYSIVRKDQKLLSSFPIGTAILAVPHAAMGRSAGKGRSTDQSFILRMEKHFAATVTVLTVLLFFIGLRQVFPESTSILAAAVFATATTLFSCASQAMWSFTGELFFVVLSLALLLNQKESLWKAGLAGIFIGLAFLCRPTALLLGGVLLALLSFQDRRRLVAFLSGCSGMTLLVILFQYGMYGHPLGAYGAMNSDPAAWNISFGKALLGNLFSPSRGILVYFPYVAVSILVAFRIRDVWIRKWMMGSVTYMILLLLLNSSYAKWWGGHSLGPRMLTEMAPFFAFLTVPVWLKWKTLKWERPVFVVFVLFAALTQFQSVYDPAVSGWNSAVQVDEKPEILWSWKNSQLAAAWLPGWEL